MDDTRQETAPAAEPEQETEYDAAQAIEDLRSQLDDQRKEVERLKEENARYLRQLVSQASGAHDDERSDYERFVKDTVKKVYDIIEARL